MTALCWGLHRAEWPVQRCSLSVLRSALVLSCVVVVLVVSLSPGLWSIGVRLHALVSGSFVSGHFSVLLIGSPTEQTAKDIGRAILEKRLAASINILARMSTMYFWKGEIQDSTEILMLVKTKTSRIQQVIDFVRSIHPYAVPEILSLSVDTGNPQYLEWMDQVLPDN